MKISKTKDVKTPTRGTNGSAGLDFYVPNDYKPLNENGKTFVQFGESIIIPSGIVADVPSGHTLVAFNKSGVATRKGLQVGACVVDEDYQGEIHIHLTNTRVGAPASIEPGEKIVQFVLLPVSYVNVEVVPKDQLFTEDTERGDGWQGSTGTN